MARWRLRAGGLLDDKTCYTRCTTGGTGHTLRTSLTPSTREALARVATHTLGKGDTPCPGRRAHPTEGRPWCVQRVRHRWQHGVEASAQHVSRNHERLPL